MSTLGPRIRHDGHMPALDLATIPTPALVLDLEVLERNIAATAERARRAGIRWRPHAKTHKCVEIGRMQVEAGAVGLAVATLAEARTFADAGIDDLTWAFPYVPGSGPSARAIAAKATLRLLVDGIEAVDELEAEGYPFPVWIEIDTGQHRSGVDPRGALVVEVARRLVESRILDFDGILTHAGHSYGARSRADLLRIADSEHRQMAELAERLRSSGIGVPGVSIGSTPTMSVADALSLDGVTEARAGNCVFYDLTQAALGSCAIEDVAISVLATVVSRQPEAGHAVLDAGALALSKDPGPDGATPSMGEVLGSDGRPDPTLHVTSVSQEHGILSRPLPRGTRVRILPNHSCLTVACHDRYVVVRDATVVAEWAIDRRR